jgi:hypothetical protein
MPLSHLFSVSPSSDSIVKWGKMLQQIGHIHIPQFLNANAIKRFKEELQISGFHRAIQSSTGM